MRQTLQAEHRPDRKLLHTEAPRPQANATVGGKVEVSPPFALKFEAKAERTRSMISLGVPQNEARDMYDVPGFEPGFEPISNGAQTKET